MKLFFVASLLVFLSACGTLFSSPSTEIALDSDPQGAEVFLDDSRIGVTPLKYDVGRNGNNTPVFTIKKAGYRTEEVAVNRAINPASMFNLGFITTTGGVTSWGIDAISGKLFRYQPNAYAIELRRLSQASVQDDLFEFVMLRFHHIQNDLARRDGESMRALHAHSGSSLSFSEYRERLIARNDTLIQSPDALSLYRQLRTL